MLHRFRDITTFTVYVTACDLEKSFRFNTRVEFTTVLFDSHIYIILYFYTTVIRRIVAYASPLWHPTLTKSQDERLEAFQRRAINIIFLLFLAYLLFFHVGRGWLSISPSKTLRSFQTFFCRQKQLPTR